ncbi:hypothetical protein sscle_14g101890 [Sclerotinia sclerotiorum 1980 UF-70]|uniref:ubiquitinyl hydrolase 1 n=1 Tax=Sclerotinia sclerotiorum (strain ATCC 18683 / 1980 / Ss-1) TaxID=665079 RepID=A0A1D9QKM6_SCLS1|nr:hypothetical protein sscle_14g101890 [Sclerotinia sclerotiorum 1980 UF-70]
MNGMGIRFTKKDKEKWISHKREKSRDVKSLDKPDKKSRSASDIFTSLFGYINKTKSENEEDEEKEKIARIKALLESEGRNDVKDDQILFCLNSNYAKGDPDKAHQILVVIQKSLSGVIYPYDPSITMLGAENSRGKSCWLDSFLASLFTVPTQFQELLSNFYEDPSKQKLIQLIRLWVNLMRKGILIEVAITERILDCLHECGWDDFKKDEEQDPTEAHMKIGDILNWPMLNLRVDYEHGGIVEQDDHRTSQERTIPVSIPTDQDCQGPLKLEKCIEYSLASFVKINRRIEPRLPETAENHDEKPIQEHVEDVEAEPATPPATPLEMIGQSSFHNQLVREVTQDRTSLYRSMSRNSTRKGADGEVEVDAFILSRLIRPSNLWSSKPAPANNQEFAHRIQEHKPMLGFDLKRYCMVMGMDGKEMLQKNKTHIDIPKKMKLPHIVEGKEDEENENDIIISNRYELVLRSMICHRGESIKRGHYISLVRLDDETDGELDFAGSNDSQQPPDYVEERWVVHDDIARDGNRVARVDIDEALATDKYGTPVTLWYEFVPIYANFSPEELQNFLGNSTPPSYTNSSVPSIDVKISKASPDVNNGNCNDEGYFSPRPNDGQTPSVRFSSEIDRPRSSLNLLDDNRRGSVAATDTSNVSADKSDYDSAPVTPSEEPATPRTSRTFRRSKTSRSRPQSSSNENRKSLGYFKGLISRTSKESLQKPDLSKESIPPVPVTPGLDGSVDSNSNVEATKATETNVTMSRKGSKKGKRRSRAIDFETKDKEKESNHTDRVCIIM